MTFVNDQMPTACEPGRHMFLSSGPNSCVCGQVPIVTSTPSASATPAFPLAVSELRERVMALRNEELERGAPTSRLVVESLTRQILGFIDEYATKTQHPDRADSPICGCDGEHCGDGSQCRYVE